MKVIVITGSTRGIGFGLAQDFLKRDCAVVISGRTAAAAQKAVAALGAPDLDRVFGQPCDVTDLTQVQNLWDAAKTRFGRVDVWINNAGVSHRRVAFWDQKPDCFQSVADTNLVGLMNGSFVAVKGMLAQGSGQIYNMEGFGSGDQMADGLLIYGSTKRAVTYFTDSLAKDLKDKPVQICHLSPGMVVTDLLVSDYDGQPERFEKVKRVFNILGDTVETVTPFLVDKILANTKNGARIAWLTSQKAFFRFMTAGFNKRDLFTEKKPA